MRRATACIYAKARHVWIEPQPRSSKGWLGYLTVGGSVRLYKGDKAAAKTPGAGCDALVPRGARRLRVRGRGRDGRPGEPGIHRIEEDRPR